MTSRFFACGAVVLTAAVAAAQDRPADPASQQQATAVTLERQATELMAKAQAARAVVARVPLEARLVKDAPYSAEVVTESTQVLGDGNRIIRRTTGRVYRDSQGRTRREEDIEPGRVGSISISDPVAEVAYSLDPQAKTAFKTPAATAGVLAGTYKMSTTPGGAIATYRAAETPPADPAELERRRQIEAKLVEAAKSRGGGGGVVSAGPAGAAMMKARAPAWDEKAEILPAKNIEGVMAEGRRVTRTIPAGAIGNEQPIVSVTEEWRSPELQVLVMTRTSDPRTGESVYKLQNIVRAEQNSSWFEVPADYAVKESGIRRAGAGHQVGDAPPSASSQLLLPRPQAAPSPGRACAFPLPPPFHVAICGQSIAVNVLN